MLDLAKFHADPKAADVVAKLQSHHWRKARDAAKELCKSDRAKYLDLLIAANVGLAREMIAKGLLKDATTVIDHLATLAPQDLVASLRAELTTPATGKHAPLAQPPAPAAAACWETAVQADAALQANLVTSLGPAENAAIDLLAADSFSPIVVSDTAPARLATELAAVRTACAATGDGRWDDARDALRTLPRQSVFRHWRMFLRGVRCVFDEDFKTARQCFSDLPTVGALARAARAIAPDLVPPGPAAPPAGKVALHLALTNQPAAWATPILDANVHLRKPDRARALVVLANGLKTHFPSTHIDLPAVLTEAVLPFHASMNDEDCYQADIVMKALLQSRSLTTRQRAELKLAALRATAVTEATALPPLDLKNYWEDVIGSWNELHGRDPFRDSLARQWLGETLLNHHLQDRHDPFGAHSLKGVIRAAQTALESAIKLDPTNESACTSLVKVLTLSGDTKARNALLDDLVKRFSENKEILFLTGQLASQRKAYAKALTSLRKALAIDPLDKAVKSEIATALIPLAREQGLKNRPTTDLWDELDRIAEDRPGHDHLQITRWLLLLRRSLLDPTPQTALLARENALRAAPSPLEFHFAEHCLAILSQINTRTQPADDWNQLVATSPITSTTLIALTAQFCHFTDNKAWKQSITHGISARIQFAVKAYFLNHLGSDPEGPLQFIDFIANKRGGPLNQYAHFILSDAVNRIREGLVAPAAIHRQKTDPSLRLARLILDFNNPFISTSDPLATLAELDAIITEASALKLPRTLARAQTMRDDQQKKINRRPTQPFPDDEDGDDVDLEDIWDFEDEFDDDNDVPFGNGIEAEALKSFTKALVSGDPRATQIIRDSLIASGHTAREADRMIAEACAADGLPNPTAKKPAKKRPKKRRRN